MAQASLRGARPRRLVCPPDRRQGGAVIRVLLRIFTSVPCIGVIGLLIMFPLALGIVAAHRDLVAGKGLDHIVDMLEGLAIILIGWGVAIEERHSLREMAGLVETPD